MTKEIIEHDMEEELTFMERLKGYNTAIICEKYLPKKYQGKMKDILDNFMVRKNNRVKIETHPVMGVPTEDMLIKTHENQFLVLHRVEPSGDLVFHTVYPAYHSEFKVKNPDLRKSVVIL